jgi:hypothetical protein
MLMANLSQARKRRYVCLFPPIAALIGGSYGITSMTLVDGIKLANQLAIRK